ncbi:M15 family metallopeptidase [Gilvibacter sp.]|uniref:M15 family metallopeptidase n=1 Tax=Gilvibacter sp. TaxID=2729997 RepID=UPI0025C0687F|nr:M15 family metallopeptidase [Gilvibacter sp.]NQX76540.1 M15 family metallopeptidase [Gilvibacter sp.]
MTRTEFIKTSLLAGMGLPLLSGFNTPFMTHEVSLARLMGKNENHLTGSSFKLEKQTMQAFLRMQRAAAVDGVTIEVASAFRSFDRQAQIWTSKYNNYTQAGMTPLAAMKKIIEYSTMPGTSRHHWGTDCDLIDGDASPRPSSVLEPRHFHGQGPFCKFKEWMDANSESFGFFEVYTDNANRKGFKYEPWHFSYKPVSQKYMETYLKFDFNRILEQISVPGVEHMDAQFIDDYWQNNVSDINPDLLPNA